MKRVFAVFVLVYIAAASVMPQGFTGATTSYYFTYAGYSNGNFSRAHSIYSNAGIDYTWYPTAAYDNLNIYTGEWSYLQQTGIIGGMYSFYPHAVKLYYAHIKGDFKLKRSPLYDAGVYDYSDFTNIYAGDYSYYDNGWYFGANAVYLNAIGVLNKKYLSRERTVQAGLRIEYIPAYEWFLSLKPSFFYSRSDKRKLYSASVKAHYLATPRLLIKAGGMIGQRAYYFDTDLLTISNQNETQTGNEFVQCEYFPGWGLALALSCVHSEFKGYQINYYVAGIRKSI